VIPKHEKISVTIILNNMKTVGMKREEYLDLMDTLTGYPPGLRRPFRI